MLIIELLLIFYSKYHSIKVSCAARGVAIGVARFQAQPGHTWDTLPIYPHPRH